MLMVSNRNDLEHILLPISPCMSSSNGFLWSDGYSKSWKYKLNNVSDEWNEGGGSRGELRSLRFPNPEIT